MTVFDTTSFDVIRGKSSKRKLILTSQGYSHSFDFGIVAVLLCVILLHNHCNITFLTYDKGNFDIMYSISDSSDCDYMGSNYFVVRIIKYRSILFHPYT